jgi:FtsH-binding integral membrane protein
MIIIILYYYYITIIYMTRLHQFNILLRSKKELIGCIFITLIIQLCISLVTMKLDYKHNILGTTNSIIIWIMLLIFMIGLILLMINPTIPFLIKQLLFGVFSIIVGLILSQTIHIINDPKLIEFAALSTLVNFVLMLVVGFIIVYFNYDLEWIGILLLISLFVIITVSIISLFTKKSKKINKSIAIVTIVIFSLYILYDTNNILLKYKNKNSTHCIMGALDYYLDIWNLFSSYLTLGKK